MNDSLRICKDLCLKLKGDICFCWVSCYWFQAIQVLRKLRALISWSNCLDHCGKHGMQCHLQNYTFLKSWCDGMNHLLNMNHILNKIGPKTNPWGTPLINSSHELKDVLTLVLYLRLINSSYELKDMLTLVLCLRLER